MFNIQTEPTTVSNCKCNTECFEYIFDGSEKKEEMESMGRKGSKLYTADFFVNFIVPVAHSVKCLWSLKSALLTCLVCHWDKSPKMELLCMFNNDGQIWRTELDITANVCNMELTWSHLL